MTPHEAYQFGLIPLVIWREARNQSHAAKVAVGWSVKNRIEHPKWWGSDYPSTILHGWQYSSFNQADPNHLKFPQMDDPSFVDSLAAAEEVFTGSVADPTSGATSYHDNSIPPPPWATTMEHTADIGAFHFYREKGKQ